jgi:hypothetical protein
VNLGIGDTLVRNLLVTSGIKMKLVILTVIAMAAVMLYVPHRGPGGDLSYSWVFGATETLDVALLTWEIGVIVFLAVIVAAFQSAARRQ